MSFSTKFYAETPAAAKDFVKQDHLPLEVQAFILAGLRAIGPKTPVFVEAFGHLGDGDGSYDYASAAIKVEPINFRSAS